MNVPSSVKRSRTVSLSPEMAHLAQILENSTAALTKTVDTKLADQTAILSTMITENVQPLKE